MTRSEAQQEQSPLAISTGVPSLDEAIGIGGYPRGRVTELFGPKKGDCKMALVLAALREAQRLGMTPAFVDAEGAFSLRLAQTCGVHAGGLLLSQPESAEVALHMAEKLTRSGGCGIVVVGHVAAALHGDEPVGLVARMMSTSLRKLTASAYKTGTAVVFMNHRESRAYTGAFGGDPPELLGTALKFYSSLRIDVRQASGPDDKPVTIAKVVKNKMAARFRKAEWR